MSWRWSIGAIAALSLLGLACKQPQRSEPPPAHHLAETPLMEDMVVRTERIEFRSTLSLNLLDRLDGYDPQRDSSLESCIRRLDPAAQARWDAAATLVRRLQEPDQGKLRTRARYGLAYPTLNFDEELGPFPAWLQDALESAEQVYRECGWPDDDQRNRAWISAMVDRLEPVETPLSRDIASALGFAWGHDPIPFDVVTHAGRSGAHTMTDPDHTVISSAVEEHQGPLAVEVVLHEATHTQFDGSRGEAMAALRTAAQQQGLQLPEELWHVILFYTVGELTRRHLEAQGTSFVPYLYAQRLFERSWPQYRIPLERHWQPYLAGDTSLSTAAAAVVSELGESPRNGDEADTTTH